MIAVTAPGRPAVTRMLRRLSAGEPQALDRLLPHVYDELRRIAGRHMAGERAGHTLGATGLVHEAYLRLAELDRLVWRDRQHFFAMASRLMRRVLVDHAQRRTAAKRGGGRAPAPLEENTAAVDADAERVLALDQALRRLELRSPRQCRVVEARFFAGLDVRETAEALGLSTATVKRDWALARAWLNRELTT